MTTPVDTVRRFMTPLAAATSPPSSRSLMRRSNGLRRRVFQSTAAHGWGRRPFSTISSSRCPATGMGSPLYQMSSY